MAVAADAVGAVGGVVAGAEVQGDLPARVARRVVAAMGRPFEIGGRRCRVQVSVGLAVADGPGPVDAEDLLRRADAAMYAAKRKGKGRLVVAHSVGASAD
ncbi:MULTISPECIES: diguanylate cyclase domain-containing protein [Pseudofrankia]|uniref:diguanylate cyclase domain-containing protein n=1 Tax=Pseudofrankia TaxID=2994363 RepID=UPI00104232D5|nr:MULTISPECIES: diguanylate cyclase [Pseudofrankia]